MTAATLRNICSIIDKTMCLSCDAACNWPTIDEMMYACEKGLKLSANGEVCNRTMLDEHSFSSIMVLQHCGKGTGDSTSVLGESTHSVLHADLLVTVPQ